MKKIVIPLALCLVVLPGCRKKTWFSWKSKDDKSAEVYGQDGTKGSKKSLFVDDVDAFVLEDEADPFAHQVSSVNMKLVADRDEAYDEHAASKQGFKTIYFDYDKYDIRSDQHESISYNVQKIAEEVRQGHTVVIEGHACEYARDEKYNMMISDHRAQAVKNLLVKKYRLADHLLKPVGRGCSVPRVEGGTREQQAPNRRVEFYVLD